MKNWERKKLGEVCIVERGSSPRPIEKYQTDSPEGVNWIKIGDTKGIDKYIFSTKEKITKEGAEKSRYVKEGDFILSNSMSFGKPYIMKTDGYIHDGWFVFRLPDYLDKDYFYYLLTSPNVQEQIQSLGAGAIVKNISGDLVKKVDITFPKSLPEQHRIVSILDEAFAAIAKAKANAEENLKNAKELFESYLQGVFENKGDGWEEKKLGEVCDLSAGGDVPKDNFSETKTEKHPIPIFANGEKNDGFYGYTSIAKVLKPSVTVSARGTIGYSVKRLEPFFPIVRLVVVTPKDLSKIDLDFLSYVIKSMKFKHSGSSIPQLTVPMIKDYVVPLPTLKDQQTIVRQLDALRVETQKLEAVYQKKMDDLEELKKSILQKAFAGELKTEKNLMQ